MESNKKKIMYESDYRKFKYLHGNRPIRSRAKKLAEEIKQSGFQVPIIVNENMEIIDGQHRVEAMKILGEPVAYYVIPGLGLRDCMRLNSTQQNWNGSDFIHGYTSYGNQSYIYFTELIKEYKDLFGNMALYVAATGHYGAWFTKSLREGTLFIGEQEYNSTREFLAWVQPLIGYFKNFGRLDHWIYVLRVCYFSDEVRKDRLAGAIVRYQVQVVSITKLEQAATVIDRIYNMFLEKTKRIDIVHLVRVHRSGEVRH